MLNKVSLIVSARWKIWYCSKKLFGLLRMDAMTREEYWIRLLDTATPYGSDDKINSI